MNDIITIKTSEATDILLDWAVSKCEGNGLGAATGAGLLLRIKQGERPLPYSTDWAIAGPLIEREGCFPKEEHRGPYVAFIFNGVVNAGHQFGLTPLVAAMRCYVKSKLGDTFDVPVELMAAQAQLQASKVAAPRATRPQP